jgi:copper(I)-binding protein
VLVVAITIFAAWAIAACGDDAGSGGTVSSDPSNNTTTPIVRNAWARTTVAGQSTGVAYMEIVGGTIDDALVRASVPATVAATVELQETVTTDYSGAMSGMDGMQGMDGMSAGSGATGMMTMQPVVRVAIPSHKKVALSPGGYHVMLVDLAKPLQTGDRFIVTLTFEKGGNVDVLIEVRTS